MSAVPYLLVVTSAFTHAYWNYLLKRNHGGQLFVGLTKIVEVTMFAPVFVAVALPDLAAHAGIIAPLAVVGASLTLLNYVMLAVAYQRGELSTVYPVSRGGVLLFLPVLAFGVFGERVDTVGGAAMALILAGIVVLQLGQLSRQAVAGLAAALRSSRGTAPALVAAAAGYTVWDKRSVQTVSPFTYFYTYTLIVAAAYAAYIARRYTWPDVRHEWKRNGSAITQVGLFNTLTYVMVLFALRVGTASYVIALRQLSIAIGVILGWRLLDEQIAPPKRVGVILLIGGTALLALAG